jgi:hypothetical protein
VRRRRSSARRTSGRARRTAPRSAAEAAGPPSCSFGGDQILRARRRSPSKHNPFPQSLPFCSFFLLLPPLYTGFVHIACFVTHACAPALGGDAPEARGAHKRGGRGTHTHGDARKKWNCYALVLQGNTAAGQVEHEHAGRSGVGAQIAKHKWA